MTDAAFVIGAYGVILGGIAVYALFLARRIRVALGARNRLDSDVDEAR